MTVRLVETENAYEGNPGFMLVNDLPKEDDLNIVVFYNQDDNTVGIDIRNPFSNEVEYEINCDKEDVELLIKALQGTLAGFNQCLF